jgi:cytochrome c peroxidase
MTNAAAILAAAIAAAPWIAALWPDEDAPVLPSVPYNYSKPELPAHFLKSGYFDGPSLDNTPRDNPVTDAGATLGRVLFYDRRLSRNDSVSCGSCHHQKVAFSDPEQFSTGFDGRKTKRHSLPLVNVRWFDTGRMFWDERALTLEDQVLMPIQDELEMGMTLEELVPKLEKAGYYQQLFTSAFGTPEITADRVSKALAQFVRSIVSYGSRYDQAAADGFENVFTEQEMAGRALFVGVPTQGDLSDIISTGRLGRATCSNCHRGDLQAGDGLRNNGLDSDASHDPGRSGHFKSPSLRNVAARARFMHDGRFKSLREVVDHYDSGIEPHPNLDGLLKRGARPVRLDMTDAEKDALIAFLNTLTDNGLLTDPKFSDPFVRKSHR